MLKFTTYFIIIFIIIKYLHPLKKLIIPSQLIATIGKMIYKDFPLNLLFCKFYYKKLRLYKVDNWLVIGGWLIVSKILNNAKVSRILILNYLDILTYKTCINRILV